MPPVAETSRNEVIDQRSRVNSEEMVLSMGRITVHARRAAPRASLRRRSLRRRASRVGTLHRAIEKIGE